MPGADIREPREGCQRTKLANLVSSTSGKKRRGTASSGRLLALAVVPVVFSSKWAAMRMDW